MKLNHTRLLVLLLLLVSTGCDGSSEPTRSIDFIPLGSIEITSQNPQAAAGTANRFTAIGHYGDPSTFQFTRNITGQVTWTSNETVLAFSNPAAAGLATAVAAGTATVTATLDAISADRPFTVSSATISTLAIPAPSATTLFAGETMQLRATGTFSDGTSQDLTETVAWSSSVPAVATVTATVPGAGLVKALSEGTTDIVATFGLSATLTLDVAAANLKSLAVTSVDGSSTLARGTSMQLLATGTYTDASTSDLTSQVTWTSSNTAVATIDQDAGTNGKLSAGDTGSTTVTANLGGIASPGFQVTVSSAELTALVIDQTSPSVSVGQDLQLSASGDFSNGTSQDLTRDVTWSSANPDIATVSNSLGVEGTVRGVAVGTVTITANSDTIPISADVVVTVQ